MNDPDDNATTYPPAPWRMTGHMWLASFAVRADVDETRPAGTYQVAFVDYTADSAMVYSELMVGRVIGSGEYRNHFTISDIWVDLPASVAGGRQIWGVPKELAQFSKTETVRGPLARTALGCDAGEHPIVRAHFTDASRLTVPIPLRGRTFQPPLPEGDGTKLSSMQARARALPCASSWEFDPDGPLAWLHGTTPRMSMRAYRFHMTMGVAETLTV
ncbi:acetoacetate decarboxylase family protein [Nocardia neocaledoniensis]|uniref:acetoacetate decarboxylase family protein n=1 Tax=Nocardia neocaledoniensis TaxID=236511 RepID=UPI002457A0FD|nr:acetoacetate decarboxylase family protein [Nocardia neocaledoniensis]